MILYCIGWKLYFNYNLLNNVLLKYWIQYQIILWTVIIYTCQLIIILFYYLRISQMSVKYYNYSYLYYTNNNAILHIINYNIVFII